MPPKAPKCHIILQVYKRQKINFTLYIGEPRGPSSLAITEPDSFFNIVWEEASFDRNETGKTILLVIYDNFL